MEPPFPPFAPCGIVTLTTDFGTRDAFVGAMKGRLLAEFPAARIIDISHDIAPQDIAEGAFVMDQACLHFPPGTIHVGVIDPGVGTFQRALIINRENQHLFLGPDNGLLGHAAGLQARGVAYEAWALDRYAQDLPLAPTFHGRDLFARVAGRLAAGAPIHAFCHARAKDPDPVRLSSVGSIDTGAVIHIDRFGNLVSSIAPAGGLDPDAGWFVELGVRQIPLVTTYGNVAPGELLAYVGSAGRIEIALRDGNAAALLGAARGEPLRLGKR